MPTQCNLCKYQWIVCVWLYQRLAGPTLWRWYTIWFNIHNDNILEIHRTIIDHVLLYLDLNECDFSPCDNNGTCINNNGSYVCSCTDGWTDKNCKEGTSFVCIKNKFISYTSNDNCYDKNGNTFIVDLTVFIFYIDINECKENHPCQNNGTCINNNGSYICQCTEGWQGHDCQIGKSINHYCRKMLALNNLASKIPYLATNASLFGFIRRRGMWNVSLWKQWNVY